MNPTQGVVHEAPGQERTISYFGVHFRDNHSSLGLRGTKITMNCIWYTTQTHRRDRTRMWSLIKFIKILQRRKIYIISMTIKKHTTNTFQTRTIFKLNLLNTLQQEKNNLSKWKPKKILYSTFFFFLFNRSDETRLETCNLHVMRCLSLFTNQSLCKILVTPNHFKSINYP